MTSRLITTKELDRMVEALTKAASFTIRRDRETCVVRHTATNEVVLAGLAKSLQGPWITRIHPNLFETP